MSPRSLTCSPAKDSILSLSRAPCCLSARKTRASVPTIATVNVARQMRALRRLLAGRLGVGELD